MMTYTFAEPRRRAHACAIFLCFATALSAPIVTAADKSTPAAAGEWHPASCPIPAGPSGPSTIKVTGPCPMEHKGIVDCEIESHDYNADVHRKNKDGGAVLLHISVEHNIVPGTFKNNELKFMVQDKKKIYAWNNYKVDMTIGPGLEWIEVHDAKLDPEPVLVDCDGPLDNYQCVGRGDEKEMLTTYPVVSGKIFCKRNDAAK